MRNSFEMPFKIDGILGSAIASNVYVVLEYVYKKVKKFALKMSK